MQAYCGRKARSITPNFGAFGASLFVAIATMHSPTCHNPIPVFSPPVPDSMSTHLFSSSLLLFSPPFSFFSFPYRALVTRVWPAAPYNTENLPAFRKAYNIKMDDADERRISSTIRMVLDQQVAQGIASGGNQVEAPLDLSSIQKKYEVPSPTTRSQGVLPPDDPTGRRSRSPTW